MIALPPAMRSGLLRQLLLLTGLVLVVVVLVVLLGVTLVMIRQPPAAIPPSPSTLVAGSIELPTPMLSEDAGEMLLRPLFWNTRRPEPEAGPAEEPPAPVLGPDVLDKVRLLGMFAAGDSAGVIINVAGQRQRLMVGEELQEWTLQGLSAAGARFVSIEDASVERLLPLEHAGVKWEPPVLEQEAAAGDEPNKADEVDDSSQSDLSRRSRNE